MGRKATYDEMVDVLICDGDLNAKEMVKVKNKVQGLLRKNHNHVILDLGKTRHVDLAGLGILVERLKAVRAAHGDLRVCNIQPQVYETLRLVGVSKLIESFPTRADAERSFKVA